MGSKKLNLLIITNEPFPEGGAASNRIRSYAKGLAEMGNCVKVLVLKPSNIVQVGSKGDLDGFKFEFASRSASWDGTNSFFKILIVIKALIKSLSIVRNNKRKDSKNIILIVSNKPVYIFWFYLTSKFYKYEYGQEKSEFPFVLNRKTFLGRIYADLYVSFIYKLFDYMIVMTTPLLNYFGGLVRKNTALFHMPMTVEVDRFEKNENRFVEYEYIAYCGRMVGEKDGVANLIKAFKYIPIHYPKIKLVLVGTASKKEMDYLIALVDDLELKSRVVFTGNVPRISVPNYIGNAKILALARPSSLQSLGGFPTKLGEYLSTSNPVLVTKVGEIPRYLKDEENAFLVEPDDIEAFGKKLLYILDNYSLAKMIGVNGKKIVDEVFNYKVQSKRLSIFLNKL